jgi:hypothetical protein
VPTTAASAAAAPGSCVLCSKALPARSAHCTACLALQLDPADVAADVWPHEGTPGTPRFRLKSEYLARVAELERRLAQPAAAAESPVEGSAREQALEQALEHARSATFALHAQVAAQAAQLAALAARVATLGGIAVAAFTAAAAQRPAGLAGSDVGEEGGSGEDASGAGAGGEGAAAADDHSEQAGGEGPRRHSPRKRMSGDEVCGRAWRVCFFFSCIYSIFSHARRRRRTRTWRR